MSIIDGMELSCGKDDPRPRHDVMADLSAHNLSEEVFKLISELEECAWRGGVDEAMAWVEYDRQADS